MPEVGRLESGLLLRSKFTMPDLPAGFLLSHRLRGLHAKMEVHPAVSVCAPAGYGKTSLAVSYFTGRGITPDQVGWCRLDPGDSDATVFVAHVLAALVPGGVEELPDPHHALAMASQELWARHDQAPGDRMSLVLDDFHSAAVNPEIVALTRFLFDNLPPSCALLVLSRARHEVFTEKHRLERGVLEVGPADLAFDPIEVRELLQQAGRPGPDPRLVDWIHRTTEGWIAGVVMLRQAIGDRGSGAIPVDSPRFGQDETLFRYLSAEVMRTIAPGVQDALARLAILADFTEDEAREILGIDRPRQLLDQAMAFGLFIQKTTGNPDVYRFHALFREVLLQRLGESLPNEAVVELHLKAAEYYLEHGRHLRVAEQLSQCGNTPGALDLLTRTGFTLWMYGEGGQLGRWLATLPEGVIRANPVLLVYRAVTMPQARHRAAAEMLAQAYRAFEAERQVGMQFWAVTALAYFHTLNNNMAGLLEATSSLLERDTAKELSAEDRGILELLTALARDRFADGRARAEGVCFSALPEHGQFLYLCYLCVSNYCLGRLDDAQRQMETALSIDYINRVDYSRLQAEYYLATTLMLKYDKTRLPALIADVISLGEKHGFDYLVAYGRWLGAYERYLALDTGSALEMLDYAASDFSRLDNRPMAAAAALLKRLWTIRPGRTAGDAREAGGMALDLEASREELDTITRSPVGMLIREFSLSVFGAIAREAGEHDLAEQFLVQAGELARRSGADQVRCGSDLHLARLYFSAGDHASGREHLEQGLGLAERGGYYSVWDIHLPTLVEAALRGIRYGLSPGFAEELLGRFYGQATVRFLAEKARTMPETGISAFADSFTADYRPDRPRPLYVVRASLFGEPEIVVNGVGIPSTEWKTRKIKGLLEYLLLTSGRTTPKATLLETFWPEADARSASASLWTALYQIRKTLAKYGVETMGSNAFIHETLTGLQIRRDEALELDVHEFQRLKAELPGLGGPRREAAIRRMLELYRGDLLNGGGYGDLVFLEREKYRSMFLEASLELGTSQVRAESPHQAEQTLRRALEVDPLNERVCLELLRLLVAQNMRSRAIGLYRAFATRFEQELDLKVDPRLSQAVAGEAGS